MDQQTELYDIEPLWHVPFWQTDRFFFILVSLAILGCLFAFILLVKKYYKRRLKTAAEVARERLAVLKKSHCMSVIHGKEFYGALTEIMKRYLYDYYQVDVLHITDQELMATLAETEHVPPAVVVYVSEVMDGVSSIKFSNAHAAQKKIDEDFVRVELMIAQSSVHPSAE